MSITSFRINVKNKLKKFYNSFLNFQIKKLYLLNKLNNRNKKIKVNRKRIFYSVQFWF